MREVTIKNIERARKLGFGWSTNPAGRGTEISPPSSPQYTGMMSQILIARNSDKLYRSEKACGTYIYPAWFYGGKKIVGVWQWSGKGYSWCDCDDYFFKYFSRGELKILVED